MMRVAGRGHLAFLVETMEINNTELSAYLNGVLEAIATGHSRGRIEELLRLELQADKRISGVGRKCCVTSIVV